MKEFWRHPALVLLLSIGAQSLSAETLFRDDFEDGDLADYYSAIDGAVVSESGGKLRVSAPSSGSGVRILFPVEGINCTAFKGVTVNFPDPVSASSDDAIEVTWLLEPSSGGIDDQGRGGGVPKNARFRIAYDEDGPAGSKWLYALTTESDRVSGRLSNKFCVAAQLGRIEEDFDHSGFLGLGSQVQGHIEITSGPHAGESFDTPFVDPPTAFERGFEIRLFGAVDSLSFDEIVADSEHIDRTKEVPLSKLPIAVFFVVTIVAGGSYLLTKRLRPATKLAAFLIVLGRCGIAHGLDLCPPSIDAPENDPPKSGQCDERGFSDWKTKDYGDGFELWCIDEPPEGSSEADWFLLKHKDGGTSYFCGRCPFGKGQNSFLVSLRIGGKIVETQWWSTDGGEDDDGDGKVDSWHWTYDARTHQLTTIHKEDDQVVCETEGPSPTIPLDSLCCGAACADVPTIGEAPMILESEPASPVPLADVFGSAVLVIFLLVAGLSLTRRRSLVQ